MDWDKLKIFHTVAEASSFTKASTILNLSQSAISRQIQSLETDLKIKLFERHARGLALTDNGKYLFQTAHEVISKLKEEITELEEVINLKDNEKTSAELGDVLFSAVNVARHAAVDPESALREANSRFENRFTWIEDQLAKEGKVVKDMGIDELNKLWSQAKLTEL